MRRDKTSPADDANETFDTHGGSRGAVDGASGASPVGTDLERALPVKGEALKRAGADLAAEPGSPRWQQGLNRLLMVQRPVVTAHIRMLRRRKPNATPAEILKTLEREYLAAVTTGGAAVGASAVIPGVGIAVSLALSGAETAYFLEASALYSQAVTEIHGIAVTDPERARTVVMAMMLGGPGADLVKQLAGEAIGQGPARKAFWGDLVAQRLPQASLGGVADLVRKQFVKRFVRSQGASIVGRAIPFGIGAVIGGIGNNTLGRRLIASSRTAFGPPPEAFPPQIER